MKRRQPSNFLWRPSALGVAHARLGSISGPTTAKLRVLLRPPAALILAHGGILRNLLARACARRLLRRSTTRTIGKPRTIADHRRGLDLSDSRAATGEGRARRRPKFVSTVI